MRKVSTDILPNGLRWYGQYDPAASGFVCGIGVRVGSAMSPREKSGLAHVTEHLVFRQSPRYTLADTYFYCSKLMGGFRKMSIATGATSMCFMSPLIRTYRNMDVAFDVISDIVKTPQFDNAAVRTEIAAVLNEHYKREADDIDTQLDLALTEAVFGSEHNARWMIREFPEEIKQLNASHVRQFIKRYFVPKNMFVVMIGPKIQDTIDRVKKDFQDWGRHTQPVADLVSIPFVPLSGAVSREIISNKTSLHHISVAVPTESYASRDAYALSVLAEILETRLEIKLREANTDIAKGIYHSDVRSTLTWLYGMLSATVYSQDKDYIRYCEEIILKEMKDLRENLVNSQEFDMGYSPVFERYANAFRSAPENLAEYIVEAACNGDEDLQDLNGFAGHMQKVTRRKLRAVADKYFSHGYARVVLSPAI
jgi:zinc protease